MDSDSAGALALLFGFLGAYLIFILVVIAIMVASMWKMFEKAGQPGWAAIVPIYNYVIILRMVGKPEWWILLFFVPLLNIVIGILVYLELAKSFGKGAGFAVGLIFLGIVFFPILGFGDARYVGPGGGRPGVAVPAW